MDFEPGDFGDLQELFQQRFHIGEVREQGLGLFLSFAAMYFHLHGS